jgi:hypothetical protein
MPPLNCPLNGLAVDGVVLKLVVHDQGALGQLPGNGPGGQRIRRAGQGQGAGACRRGPVKPGQGRLGRQDQGPGAGDFDEFPTIHMFLLFFCCIY